LGGPRALRRALEVVEYQIAVVVYVEDIGNPVEVRVGTASG
jgi:hypothetical protein